MRLRAFMERLEYNHLKIIFAMKCLGRGGAQFRYIDAVTFVHYS